MQTQIPPLYYWNDITKRIMKEVVRWRESGLPVYFTIDAGPNVHLICEGKNKERVTECLTSIQGIQSVIVNEPAKGAHTIETHLF